MVTPKHNITLLLLHNWNVATFMNCNVNIWCAGYMTCDPCERVIQCPHHQGVAAHRLRTTALTGKLNADFILMFLKEDTRKVNKWIQNRLSFLHSDCDRLPLISMLYPSLYMLLNCNLISLDNLLRPLSTVVLIFAFDCVLALQFPNGKIVDGNLSKVPIWGVPALLLTRCFSEYLSALGS